MANFDGNKDILHYTLTYFINSSESSTAMQERLSSNVTSYNVTSLKPYSTHIFEMTATNEIGVSDISTKSVDTLPDRPTSPQSVNVLVISSRSLNVRWQAPKEENGIILTYVIYYGRVGRGERHSIVAMESERSKNITNLKPYTNYSVAMVANTSVGYGEKSDLKFACTNEAAPSSPRNLTLWARNSTTISVSWLPPKNENGIIIQYAIHVREQGVNSNERLVNVSGGATSTLINVLKPFTNYTFRIRARTSAGWGNFSENRTEPTDVGPPVKPTVVPITFLPTREEFDPTRMIAITFTKFSNKNGNIKFYRVIVVMVDETVTNIAETFSRNLLSYQEWIRRENKIGFPYIAFVFKGDSFEQHKNFIVGDGEESDHTYRRKKRATLHKNGNLIPGKQYAVALRGYTAETKYATSEYLKVSTQPAEQDAVHTPV
ncbi:phosphatidylinositol phosphatase PTPRQ-like isoform X1, partial [Paramuricea clavata]